MASFPGNIGWERPRNRDNKYYRSLPFQHDPQIGWKRMRRGENKNYRSIPLQPDA